MGNIRLAKSNGRPEKCSERYTEVQLKREVGADLDIAVTAPTIIEMQVAVKLGQRVAELVKKVFS